MSRNATRRVAIEIALSAFEVIALQRERLGAAALPPACDD